MEKKRKYITGIDGLRSISVFGVILYHLTPRLMPGGFLGVTLFFVISGYLMTDILLSEWQNRRKIALTDFYIKRARRIYPSLLIVFVLSGSTFLFLSKELLTNFREIVMSSLFNFNNFWQILNGSSYFDRFGNESAFTHLWSLSIEGQFYLLWPIIIAFLLYKQDTYKRLTQFIIGGIIISSILMIVLYNPTTLNRIYYGTDTRIFSILLGSYLAIFLKDYKERIGKIKDSQKLIAFALSISLILLSFILMKDNTPFVYQGGMFIFSVVSTILLGIVIVNEKSNYILTNKLFKWIGTRSYEIYLWQFPVMITYEKLVKWDGSNSFWHLLLQLLLILLLSELTYQTLFFIRNQRVFSKKWLLETLEKWHGQVLILSSVFLIGVSVYGFYTAPSGRSKESVSLEKKLKENKEFIEANKNNEKRNKTYDSSTEEEKKETKDVKEKELYTLSTEETNYLKELHITAIGDSLLLSAAPEIQSIFPQSEIDAEVGRQFVDSKSVFEEKAINNQLSDVILVVLGTNGSFTSKDVSEIMDYTKDKNIFFVNTMVQRPWQKNVNDELVKTEKTYKNAHVIDWKAYSADMAGWFDVDDVHLTPTGAENFSNLIGKEVYKELKK